MLGLTPREAIAKEPLARNVRRSPVGVKKAAPTHGKGGRLVNICRALSRSSFCRVAGRSPSASISCMARSGSISGQSVPNCTLVWPPLIASASAGEVSAAVAGRGWAGGRTQPAPPPAHIAETKPTPVRQRRARGTRPRRAASHRRRPGRCSSAGNRRGNHARHRDRRRSRPWRRRRAPGWRWWQHRSG